jgi:hypothetical protein
MKDLSLHILDIVHNSLSAGANLIEISIFEKPADNAYEIRISDNGKGIASEMLDHVTDPFFTSRKTRKVGLGLSLLKQNAERTGGFLTIESVLRKGTTVFCRFILDNFDRPAIGDIAGVVVDFATSFPDKNFIYKHETPKGNYVFDTVEVKETLGEMPINTPSLRSYLKEMIDENLDEIGIIR